MKKIIMLSSVLVCISILLFCETVAISPSNYEEENAGSIDNPYLIENLGNLRWLSEHSEVWGSKTERYYFKQTAAIDAQDTITWNEGKGFSTIGNASSISKDENQELYFNSAFFGYYDGGNFSISNIYISNEGSFTETRFASFWGALEEANITSVRLDNILYQIKNSVVGAFCNFSQNSIITNCSITGNIIVNDVPRLDISGNYISDSTASGLIHQSWKNNITNCFSTVNIISAHNSPINMNGLVYEVANSTISNSYYKGAMLNPDTQSSGLICSFLESEMINCYAYITTNAPIYGISWNPSDSTAQNCYFYKNSMIKKAFPKAAVNNFFSNMIFKEDYGVKYIGNGLDSKDFKKKDAFKGFEFDTIWAIEPEINEGIPYLLN